MNVFKNLLLKNSLAGISGFLSSNIFSFMFEEGPKERTSENRCWLKYELVKLSLVLSTYLTPSKMFLVF